MITKDFKQVPEDGTEPPQNYKWDEAKKCYNVDGDVSLSGFGLTKFPYDYGVVTGNFHCKHNKLKSLVGGPKRVGGNYDCSHNQLKNLVGSPEVVGRDFICSENFLSSFIGASLEVNGDFYCFDNGRGQDHMRTVKGLGIIRGRFEANGVVKKLYNEHMAEKRGITEDLKKDPELEDIKQKLKSLAPASPKTQARCLSTIITSSLSVILAQETGVETPPQQPTVLEDAPLTEEQKESILSHTDQALKAQTFEDFLTLVNDVIINLELNPITDTTYVAGLLNAERVKEGMEPL